MKRRRGGVNLDSDLSWAKRELQAGRIVMCVRTRRGGLVVTFLSSASLEPEKWLSFDGEPLEEFTLTPITLNTETGEPMFGIEAVWPTTRDEVAAMLEAAG